MRWRGEQGAGAMCGGFAARPCMLAHVSAGFAAGARCPNNKHRQAPHSTHGLAHAPSAHAHTRTRTSQPVSCRAATSNMLVTCCGLPRCPCQWRSTYVHLSGIHPCTTAGERREPERQEGGGCGPAAGGGALHGGGRGRRVLQKLRLRVQGGPGGPRLPCGQGHQV